MEPENLDIESFIETGRDAVKKSIRPMSLEEVNSLLDSFFPDGSHPWSNTFREFVQENANDTFYHANALDHVQIVYCPAREKGIWFIPECALGILDGMPLKVIKELVNHL